MREAPGSDVIKKSYLMVIFSLPFYVDELGRRYLDPLWVKDLIRHAEYLPNLTLASPRRDLRAPNGFVALDSVPELAALRCVDLPFVSSTLAAIKAMPLTVYRLWKAVGAAEIIHSSIAAWPIPEAWILTPLLIIRRRFHIIIVESAPWRKPSGRTYSANESLRAFLFERLGKKALARADLTIYTQDEYRNSLFRGDPRRAHVIPASWIDESIMRSQVDIARDWAAKMDCKKLKLVFAGRLTNSKGLKVLLSAVSALASKGQSVELSIYGEGELKEECAVFAANTGANLVILLCGSLPYNHIFFTAIRNAHLMVIPSLSDEQPRIVFDAFSQGLPVVASRTPGLANCFEDHKEGIFFIPGDVAGLTQALSWAASNSSALSRMGINSGMHRKRFEIMTKLIQNLNI
jgi:glycosyltransferase involved in cell wall biosynthesis